MADEESAGGVNPLRYYQKPTIGDDDRLGQKKEEHCAPIQLVFPTGGFGIGVVPKTTAADAQALSSTGSLVVVAARPMAEATDNIERFWLKVAFCFLAVINLIITSMMYFEAAYVDTSKVAPVDPSVGGFPQVFEVTSKNRRDIETISYAFTYIAILIGMVSVIMELVLGISAYCLAITLNFVLGTYSLPLFAYSLRYMFDVFLLYLALIIRSRLTYTFLPLHVHRS